MKKTKFLKVGISILLTITMVASMFLMFTTTSFAYSSRTFEVGPGQAYENINNVPWESLNAGDTVNIHWKPEAYKEKFVLATQGTEKYPVTVHGVPGPNGELPVLDGNNATTRRQASHGSDNRSIIKVGTAAFTVADFMPKYIVIENLELKSARKENKYTRANGTTIRNYSAGASAIYVEKGENITVRNCTMHDCGNGFFVASSNETEWGPAYTSKDILVEGCSIYDNGNAGSMFEHNSYCAAINQTYQFNHYGQLRDGTIAGGATGYGLKDRGANTLIRYNWIEGGRRQISLDDGQDSTDIPVNAKYDDVFVYGNVLVEPDGVFRLWGDDEILSYGGDDAEIKDRTGTLYFYNNTIVSYRTNKTTNPFQPNRQDRTVLFYVPTNDQKIDMRNNIFFGAGDAQVSITGGAGTVSMSNNWINSGYIKDMDGADSTATFDGEATTITGTNPGFVDVANKNFHLTAASACKNKGGALAEKAMRPLPYPNTYDAAGNPVYTSFYPKQQYGEHQKKKARPLNGKLDIGAFEY